MSGFSPKHHYYLGEDEAYGRGSIGSGSAQTLPMTEEQMAAVKKRPLGFVVSDDPPTAPRRKRKKKRSA